jgi:3-deoxy-D-manno-octulosonic-acid transferase
LPLFVYSLVWWFLLPWITLYLLWRSRVNRGYRQHFAERLGFLPRNIKKDFQGAWVVHAASVGEVEAIRPFIEQMKQAFPQRKILVSCNTPTGRERIQFHFGDSVGVVYWPFDWKPALTRWINRLQPCGLLLVETELWPGMIHYCYQKL